MEKVNILKQLEQEYFNELKERIIEDEPVDIEAFYQSLPEITMDFVDEYIAPTIRTLLKDNILNQNFRLNEENEEDNEKELSTTTLPENFEYHMEQIRKIPYNGYKDFDNWMKKIGEYFLENNIITMEDIINFEENNNIIDNYDKDNIITEEEMHYDSLNDVYELMYNLYERDNIERKYQSYIFLSEDKKIEFSKLIIEFLKKIDNYEEDSNEYIKEYIIPILKEHNKNGDIKFDLKSKNETIKENSNKVIALTREMIRIFTKEYVEYIIGIAKKCDEDLYNYRNFLYTDDKKAKKQFANRIVNILLTNYKKIEKTDYYNIYFSYELDKNEEFNNYKESGKFIFRQ